MKTIKILFVALLTFLSYNVKADSISYMYQVKPIVVILNDKLLNTTITVADSMQIDSIEADYGVNVYVKMLNNIDSVKIGQGHWHTPQSLGLLINGKYHFSKYNMGGSNTIYIILSHKPDTIKNDSIVSDMKYAGKNELYGVLYYDTTFIVPYNYILDSIKISGENSVSNCYIGTKRLTTSNADYSKANKKVNTMYKCNYTYNTKIFVSALDADITQAYFYLTPIKNVIKYVANTNINGSALSENHSEINIEVYPNPATDHISVEIPEISNHTIRLINLNGSIINETQVTDNITNIPLNNAGIYFVQIVKDNSILITKKLIVQ